MPEDVKSMLGRTSPSRRETLKTRHLSRETVRQPRRQARDSSAPPPSIKRKFEEHDKRKVITEFLRSPKKSSVNLESVPLRLQTARERKVTVVNAMRSPDKKISTVSLTSDLPAKPDLGDIIIAAAAAKMVKLDPTVPRLQGAEERDAATGILLDAEFLLSVEEDTADIDILNLEC